MEEAEKSQKSFEFLSDLEPADWDGESKSVPLKDLLAVREISQYGELTAEIVSDCKETN